MAQSTIVKEELPLFKEVEYRYILNKSATTSRTISITANQFVDKDGNSYSPILSGGYNVIGFSCYVQNVHMTNSSPGIIVSGTGYSIPTGIRMRMTNDQTVLIIMDRRGNSGTFTNVNLSIMAFYLRADVDGEYIAPIS